MRQRNRNRLQRDKVKNQNWETLSEMGIHQPTPAQVCIPAWKSPISYFLLRLFTPPQSLTGLWLLTVSRHKSILWRTLSPTFAETPMVTVEDHGVTPTTPTPAGSTATRPAAMVCANAPALVLFRGKTYQLPICLLIGGDLYRAAWDWLKPQPDAEIVS